MEMKTDGNKNQIDGSHLEDHEMKSQNPSKLDLKSDEPSTQPAKQALLGKRDTPTQKEEVKRESLESEQIIEEKADFIDQQSVNLCLDQMTNCDQKSEKSKKSIA